MPNSKEQIGEELKFLIKYEALSTKNVTQRFLYIYTFGFATGKYCRDGFC